jgi:type II secretory pathway pseudopilin PulG
MIVILHVGMLGLRVNSGGKAASPRALLQAMNIHRSPVPGSVPAPMPVRLSTSSAGFTLLELLVVIIGLLAAYVGPKYFSQLGKSEVTVAKAQIEAFERALDTFRLDVGHYPTSRQEWNSLERFCMATSFLFLL